MKPKHESKKSPQPNLTPEIISKLILFALSELSGDNAHHDFEHICRHITRRRICSNIIPATGPVSGGGDRGADFETIYAHAGADRSQYWRLVSGGKILFACSIEQNLKRKIKADVKAAAEFSQSLDRMYFFYNRPIKIGDRNKFKDHALEQHGIRLEIIDAKAIAEFLADPELLWIAERYLSLPSEVSLPPVGTTPVWYSPLIEASESDLPINSDTFYQLKSALRYARANPDHHSEIPKLVHRVQLFRSHPDPVIARKAFYEEFVVMLRGLNAVEGYESQVIEYLSAIDTINEPSALEDVALILSYTNTACSRKVLEIDPSLRLSVRDELLSKLDSLITEEPSFANCEFLFIKGYVLLMEGISAASSPESSPDHLTRSTENVIGIWNIVIKHSRYVTFFPVERFSSLITFMFPLVKSENFLEFVKRFDALTAERAGIQAVAEQCTERASALLDSKQYPRALQEFHEALRLSQSSESQSDAIIVCLQLAALYYQIGLYHAAKYYGLAVAYAALRLPEDDLRKFAALGLGLAAESDYASGASLLFFLTCKSFLIIANEYAMAGRQSFREEQWAKIDYYSLLLTRIAKIISNDLHLACKELLRRLDVDDMYLATENKLEEMFKDIDRPSLNSRYANEGIAAPFCDYAPVRQTAWKQFGAIWRLEWHTTHNAERYGEAMCSALQIVFAAVSGTEFSIIATDIAIKIDIAHTGGVKIKRIPDNETLRFSVFVDPVQGMDIKDQLTIAYMVLSEGSAIPSEDFKLRFDDEFKRGLPQKIGVYISPAEAFSQFYLEDDYREIHNSDPAVSPDILPATKTWEGISDASPLHPQFVEAEALEIIENRYRRTTKLFPYTLRQLSTDPVFLKLVTKLRADGWKDWHILLGTMNVRVSSFLNMPTAKHEKLARRIAIEGEQAEYPLTPTAFFDEKQLKIGLELSQISTLENLGFRVDQRTPNFKGIDAFLRRFKYWDLDVPHKDPFISEE